MPAKLCLPSHEPGGDGGNEAGYAGHSSREETPRPTLVSTAILIPAAAITHHSDFFSLLSLSCAVERTSGARESLVLKAAVLHPSSLTQDRATLLPSFFTVWDRQIQRPPWALELKSRRLF